MKLAGIVLLLSAGVITLFGGASTGPGGHSGFAPPIIEITLLPAPKAD